MFNRFFIRWVNAAVLLLCLQACENDIATVNSITAGNDKNAPSESSKEVEFLYSDSAKVQLKLTAAQINRYGGEKPYFEMKNGLHIYFYKNYPAVETELRANYGVGHDNVNGIDSMEVKGNVRVTNAKGEKLNTEHLIWNAHTKKIYTHKFVKITTAKNEVLMGNGLEANEDFSQYEIKEPVGEIPVDESMK